MSYPPLAPDIDTEVLLQAIAAVETDGGRNNWPRVERSYMLAGATFTIQGHLLTGTGTNVNPIVANRWGKWGLASAASWGWWQILYHTAADLSYAGPPWDLMDSGVCEPYVVKQLQKIAARGATTVRQFADAWNSGSFLDANIPTDYMDQVEAAYQKAIAARTA